MFRLINVGLIRTIKILSDTSGWRQFKHLKTLLIKYRSHQIKTVLENLFVMFSSNMVTT